jgi:hypothetical protein
MEQDQLHFMTLPNLKFWGVFVCLSFLSKCMRATKTTAQRTKSRPANQLAIVHHYPDQKDRNRNQPGE